MTNREIAARLFHGDDYPAEAIARIAAELDRDLSDGSKNARQIKRIADALDEKDAAVRAPFLVPVPMLLTCPSCGARHVDQGEFATRHHHTHACQACGMCWRPALVNTVGVQFLPGFKDAP